MTTRSNTKAKNILPLSDPEAIIRKNNAEKRLTSKADRTIAPRPSSTTVASGAVTMSDTPATPVGQEQTTESSRTPADTADLSTAKEWFKAVLKIQHTSIVQAQEDRRQALEDRRADRAAFQAVQKANSDRIGRLEDILLAMNIKNEIANQPGRQASGRVDLQKFRTSDGPTYRGPFQETESFLRWIHGVQIFFGTKDVTDPADKIRIVGNLIAETNLQSFYANEASTFLNRSWEDFKVRLFEFALPDNWRSGLKRQIRQLEMTTAESFLEYSTRARTLQSLFNFDATINAKLGDLDLAQFVVYGLPDDLNDRITELQLLEVVPFAYGSFEKRANASSLALHRTKPLTNQNRSSTAATNPSVNREEFLWRVHAFLDSQGRCHFCKKTCGNASGTCPGPIDRTYIEIPSSFQTPPKPINYTPPRAWSKPTAAPGKATQPAAGRPPTRAASVAGIADVTPLEARVAALTVNAAIREDARHDQEFDDEGCFPSLDTAAVSALEDLDKQLLQNEIDQATQMYTGWTDNLADDIAGC
jgi:hypothetical protein